jgi:hypothetical protein
VEELAAAVAAATHSRSNRRAELQTLKVEPAEASPELLEAPAAWEAVGPKLAEAHLELLLQFVGLLGLALLA